jgi:NAD(P)-dependent dehydrogenase (short-subunit alcohol dehydrogenase family)
MLDELQKIALITGSAIRIGKYVTESLARDGWKIALHYNSSEMEAYELAKKLINQVDILLFKADLTEFDQASGLIDRINQQLGPVSLIINNASIYKNDNLMNLNNDLLLDNLNIHANAPIHLAKAMASQGIDGNIINIIDSDITKIKKKFFSYSLSKKMLYHLTQMLAVSLAPSIRVNAIAPGAILFKEGQNKELFNQFIENSPLKSKTELKDLYQTIQFLINTHSITGQCIFLDGGQHLNM